jgi:hypothetical protein
MVQKEVNHEHYGEVIYDKGGYLVCHICGRGGFRQLGTHIRMSHSDVVDNMHDYKVMFGLNVKKGLLIEETRKIKADKVWENETVLNLMGEKSIKARFKKGSKGRTIDKVSEQCKREFTKRILKENGYIIEGNIQLHECPIPNFKTFQSYNINVKWSKTYGKYIIRGRKTKALYGMTDTLDEAKEFCERNKTMESSILNIKKDFEKDSGIW